MTQVESYRQQWTRDKHVQSEWVHYIKETFQNRQCVFGSLVYPRKPHMMDVSKSVRIYAEQVMSRSCKSHSESLRRVFIAEQTPGEEIKKARVRLIPMNGEIRHLLIKRPGVFESQIHKGMPDIPHIHFIMEVPKEIDPLSFVKLCTERWLCMNREDMSVNCKLAKIEIVNDISAVARYITKGYVESQGENIILNHATALG